MISAYGAGKVDSKPCGSRTGCWTCTHVQEDQSLKNMLETPEMYWLKPLYKLRSYIVANHYNPAKRNWISRTMDENGCVDLAPNAYAPDYCLELLRLVLSIQAEEYEDCYRKQIEPRFELLSLENVLAIELMWSRYGYHKGLEACHTWKQVFINGKRWHMPDNVEKHPRIKFPEKRKLKLSDQFYGNQIYGFRDIQLSFIDQESTVIKKGKYYTDCNTGDEYSIDEEAAHMFFSMELDYALERYYINGSLISPTATFSYLTRLGVVSFAKGSHSKIDKMLQLGNQVWRSGIRDCLNDPNEIIRRVGAKESIDKIDLFD